MDNQRCAYEDNDPFQRQANPPVITEPLAPWTEHHGVALVPDGSQEGAGGSHRHSHQEGIGGVAHGVGNAHPDGSHDEGGGGVVYDVGQTHGEGHDHG